MRFLVVSKGSGRGTGGSQAARYVARRKNDDERKAEEPTKLFNAHAETLGDKRANLWLGDGRVPPTGDVQHLVLSFAHEDDFLALGDDEAARQQALRELTRGTMAEMAERLNAQELRWVAGIHRNTDNPHIHLLLQRSYVDRAGRSQRLSTKRPEWRVRYEPNEQGERIIQPSPMSQIFARVWEEQITQRATKSILPEQSRLPDEHATGSQRAREILGRALLAQMGLEALAQQRADLHQFGEYRRYAIVDEAGNRKRLSGNDLHTQAHRHARQLIARIPFELPVTERQALRERLQEQWLAERTSTLDQIAAAQAKEAEKLAVRQAKFQEQAEPILASAQAIQQRYEKEGTATLLPALSPTALTYLQERAIRQGDALRLTSLEEIRLQLAAEKNAAARTEKELARFVAQQILAEARLQIERQKAAEFETNQHLYRWGIPADHLPKHESRKASLASLERALRRENDQAKFIGARHVHWDDERRAQAQMRVKELISQRAFIQQQMAERRAELEERVERQEAVVNALNAIGERENERRKWVGQTLPIPRFNAVEMRELELLAERRGDMEFTRRLLDIEMGYDAQTFSKNESPLAMRTSRAFARVILAEIVQHEATRQQRNFLEKRDQIDVLLKDSGAKEIVTARLADVVPRSRLERAFPTFFAKSPAYQAVVSVLSQQEQYLAEERQRVAQNRVLLTEAAHTYAKEFQQAFPDQPLPRPMFHSQEMARWASYLERETDTVLREHYEAVYQLVVRDEGSDLPERNPHDLKYEASITYDAEMER